ncbi:Regulator of G protein signaling superfamily [Apiospora rasikravindrae]|uniref:Regulator of G protein signaling superfamily n=1 Tax=Apiospora rasikravindrae TaxID=990691 RepID=A0ABR1TI19_9PEZI
MLLCERVVAPTELLEAILLCMDIRTLLTSAQRVCRRWHHLIGDSPSLQKALFFEPDNTVLPTSPLRNPLLAEVFTVWFDYNASSALGANGQDHHYYRDFQASPFARNLDVVLHKDASWKRMLVQQPPLLHLGDWRHTYDEMGHHEELLVHEPFPHGLRMENLYFLTFERMKAGEFASVRMLWDFKHHQRLSQSNFRIIGQDPPARFLRWKLTPDVVMESNVGVSCTGDGMIADFMLEKEFTLNRDQGKKDLVFLLDELAKLNGELDMM